MKTKYYRATTLNSIYFLRHSDLMLTNPHQQQKTEVEVWGRGMFFTLTESRKPVAGEQMIGRDASGLIRTTVVKKVERIGFKAFFRGNE